MIELKEEDIPVLDGLLAMMVERNGAVTPSDLSDFEKYKEIKYTEYGNIFKSLAYFFDQFGCGEHTNTQSSTSWILPTSSTHAFKGNGGFKKAFEGSKKEKSSNIVNDFSGSTIGQLNQSSTFSNSPETTNIKANSSKPLSKNVIVKFWKLISENKLISGLLLIVIIYLIKVIFGIDLKS